MAQRLHCASITLRKIEADQSHPSRQLATLLAEQLSIPPDQRDAFVRFARTGRQSVQGDSGQLSPTLSSASGISADRTGLGRPKALTFRRNNLPAFSTPFVGREHELAQIARLLTNPECRLLTLVGYGGMGKSRLAIQAAAAHIDLFTHGAVSVQLEAITTTDLIIPTLLRTLNLTLSAATSPLDQALNYLRDKQLLLVLDNFEHLIDQASLVSNLLQGCGQIKLIVTSRERLNLLEEWVIAVEGLPLPPATLEEASDTNSALMLFTQRARRLRSEFTPTAETYPAIRRICELVHGMPLGIELAAAGVLSMAPDAIAHEIAQHHTIPGRAPRNLPSRQRSLRDLFESSWGRLSGSEQQVLARLAIFRAGFRAEAAAAVAGATFETLAALVDRSLLQMTPASRYGQHPLVYEYAREKLARSEADLARTAERHARYYAGFLHARGSDLMSARQVEAMHAIDAELDNVRAMWQWAIMHRDPSVIEQAVFAVAIYCEIRGFTTEGARLFGHAVAMLRGLEPGDVRDAALGCALSQEAGMHFWIGPLEATERLASEAIACLQHTSAHAAHAQAFLWRGLARWRLGKYQAAKADYEQSLAAYRAIDDRWGEAWNLGLLGFLDILPFDERECLFRQSITMLREIGTQHDLGIITNGLGLLYLEVGNYAAAQVVLQEAMRYRDVYDRTPLPYTLNNLGRAALGAGDLAAAQRYWEEALAAGREQHEADTIASSLIGLGEAALAQNALLEAEGWLRKGLEVARQTGIQFTLLRGCVALVRLLVAQALIEPALLLLLVILDQPALEPIARAEAAQLRVAVEAMSSPETIAAARAAAGERTLGDLVAAWLA